LNDLIDWIYDPPKNYANFEKACHNAFFAFKAISECHPSMTKLLFSSDKYMKKIYQLSNNNKEENVTSRGYF